MWLDNGVHVSKESVKTKDSVDVTYAGLLRNSGASGVLLHCGFDGWREPSDIWMTRDVDGSFRTSVKADAKSEINMCFKDTADNWDNNNGWNWCVRVK
jgi:hypothetical protein